MTASTTTATDSLIQQLECLYADREELFNAFGTATVEEIVSTIRSLEDQLLSIYAESEDVPESKDLPEDYDGASLWTSTDTICDELAAVSADVADRLDFGFIRMDDEGTVEVYNKWEMDLADMHRSEVINRNFFTQVAPCTHNRLFFHSLKEATDNKEGIDTRLSYTFTYRMKPTPVDIRMVRDSERLKFYMLIRRA